MFWEVKRAEATGQIAIGVFSKHTGTNIETIRYAQPWS
jgi:hypothetical protein